VLEQAELLKMALTKIGILSLANLWITGLFLETELSPFTLVGLTELID